jgi:uncharacterized membrane protein
MYRDTLLFFAALLLALTVGRSFWATIGESPFGMSGRTYVDFFQHLDQRIHQPIAFIAMGGTLLAGLAALAFRDQRRPFLLLVTACALGIVASVATATVNVPINKIIATWDPAALPAGYEDHLRRWWMWHQVRFAALFVATCAVFLAMLTRNPSARVH